MFVTGPNIRGFNSINAVWSFGRSASHWDCAATGAHLEPARSWSKTQSVAATFDNHLSKQECDSSGIVNSEGFTRGFPPLIPGLRMATTPVEKEAVVAAANLLRSMGASEVFLFGSATTGQVRSDSDVDLAVKNLPPRLYFSAVNKASDLLGRPVDLVDLDDDSPRVRHLLRSGELVRVG
jgi:predicted nucleotidyltransferase